jgi:hypothetical protein
LLLEKSYKLIYSHKPVGTIKLPLVFLYIMNNTNNAIFATIFVAMIMATGMTTAYVFAPSPAVLYEPVQGENPTQGLSLAGGRGR